MASVVSNLTHVLSPPSTTSPLNVVRHRFTVEQYHEMIERGIFAEDEPIELIRGEIVKKMPNGNSHAACVKRLNRLLSSMLSEELLVSVQDPICVGDSEPEPDVAILEYRDDLYASRRPIADDVRLLIEVSETSLGYDRDIKGPIYAEAGIREYWLVNLTNATIEVYRDPQSDGRFATVTTARREDRLSPLAITDWVLSVDEILGQD